MYSGKNCDYPTEDVQLMDKFYKEFKKAKEIFRISRNSGFEDSTSAVHIFSDTIRELRDKIIENIGESIEYQCDLAIYVSYELYTGRTKDFCWELYGNQIVRNLQHNSPNPPLLPVPDDNGDLAYLWKRYSLTEVNV